MKKFFALIIGVLLSTVVCNSSVIYVDAESDEMKYDYVKFKSLHYGSEFKTLDSVKCNSDTIIDIDNDYPVLCYVFLDELMSYGFLMSINDTITLKYSDSNFEIDDKHSRYSELFGNYRQKMNIIIDSCDFLSYSEKLDSVLNSIHNDIETDLEDKHLINFYKAYYEYSAVVMKLDYYMYYYSYGDCSDDGKSFSKIEQMNDLNDFNSGAILDSYRFFVEKYCQIKMVKEGEILSTKKEELDFIDRNFEGLSFELAAQWWISKYIDRIKSEAEFNELSEIFHSMEDSFANNDILNSLRNIFRKRSIILPGKPIVNFEIPTIDDEKLSLDSFNDKIIYISFWSSGCLYCIEEHKAFNEIHDKYKTDSNIVFINISLEEKESLLNYLENNELPGYQCYLDLGFHHNLSKQYLISGVPQYMIINKGKYFDIDAPRPRDERLTEKLDKLLTE